MMSEQALRSTYFKMVYQFEGLPGKYITKMRKSGSSRILILVDLENADAFETSDTRTKTLF